MAEMQPTATPRTVRNVSDTARWAAYFRAQETARRDALLRDPFADRLCGTGWTSRTPFRTGTSTPGPGSRELDHFINQELQRGVDLVLNLAAGLDARPYRMQLPASLEWIEVDLPEILAYKEEILASEKPTGTLERVRLNLADGDARRTLFAELDRRAKKILVLTEGLLIYLSEEEVARPARDLASGASFQRWIMDLGSPGLLKMMQKTTGKHLSKAGAPFKFAPAEGPAFFTPHGWEPMEVKAVLQTAAKLKRPPFFLRLLARLPERKGPAGNRPWSEVCLFRKTN